MPSRRRTLRLGAAGLAGLAGCLGRPSGGAPTVSPAPVPDATDPSPAPSPSPGPPSASPTPAADLEPWSYAWEHHVDREHVLGLDAAGGMLYATLSDGGGPSAVAAVDPAGPDVRWQRPLEGEAVAGSDAGARSIASDGWGVTIAGDAVYAVTGRAAAYGDTVLAALDRATGEVRWSLRRPRRLAVRGVHDDLVVATAREYVEPEHAHDTPSEPPTAALYGLDAEGGGVRWTAEHDGVVDVAVGAGGVHVAAGDRLVGYDLDGEQRYAYTGAGAPARAVRAAGERVYYLTEAGADHSTVHGLGPGGDRAWRLEAPVEEVLLGGDRLYAGGASVLALAPDGTVAWRDDRYGRWLLAGPAGETLYARAGRGADRVRAFRARDGVERWTYRPPDLSSADAWPVAATRETLVAEGITGEDASDAFTTLYAVDRDRGEARAYASVEPVFDVEAVGGTVVVAGASVLALES